MRVQDDAARAFYEQEAYLQFLPSEQELMLEIARERKLVEAAPEE